VKWLTLNLGGQRWAVHVLRDGAKALEGAQGVTDVDTARIYVSRDLAPDVFEDTFLHELLHAVLYVSGGTQALEANCRAGRANDTEEQVIRCVVPVLHRLLKDLGFEFPKGPYE
jgi:hypothetical protein